MFAQGVIEPLSVRAIAHFAQLDRLYLFCCIDELAQFFDRGLDQLLEREPRTALVQRVCHSTLMDAGRSDYQITACLKIDLEPVFAQVARQAVLRLRVPEVDPSTCLAAQGCRPV